MEKPGNPIPLEALATNVWLAAYSLDNNNSTFTSPAVIANLNVVMNKLRRRGFATPPTDNGGFAKDNSPTIFTKHEGGWNRLLEAIPHRPLWTVGTGRLGLERSRMALSEESLVAMRVAHLGMIQGVITRMSGFSASAKTFLVTILAGLAAISLQANSIQLGAIAMIAAVLLFLIDTYYMTLEVQFRTFYDEVIARHLDDAPNMGIAPSVRDGDTQKALTSKSNLMFYVPVLFACILFIVYGGIHESKAGRLFGADHSRVEQPASAKPNSNPASNRIAEPVRPAPVSTGSGTGRYIRGLSGKATASPEPVRK